MGIHKSQLGQDKVALNGGGLPTCNRFSVKTSSVRFSHSPIESVRWVSLFWSTFKMDSCFKQPGHTRTHIQKTVIKKQRITAGGAETTFY